MFKPFLLQKKQFTLNALGITNRIPTPKFKNNVICTAVQSDGKILVGGSFIDYGNTTNRSYLIRLNSDNTLDTTFCVAASDGKFSGSIYSIVVQSDGKILVGGAFLNYPGAVNRNYLIRLNNDGTTDNDFCVAASDGGKFNTAVWSIAVQPDNKILVGGDFTNYPGATNRNRFIRLDSNGLVDNDFCVAASDGSKFNGRITSIAVQSDGKILVGGNFFTYPGGTNRSYLIRLNNNGTTDNPFCVNAVDGTKFNGNIESIAVQSDGKILVGGAFLNYPGGTNRNRLIRLNSDGQIDNDFCVAASDGASAKFSSIVYSIAVQSDGKILVGGQFTAYSGQANRNYLIRLNGDGTVDSDFCVNATDGVTAGKFSASVLEIIVQSDGKILVGGSFVNYPFNVGTNRFLRLNSDGTLDIDFCSKASSTNTGTIINLVNTIAVQPDGKILVGGSFTNYAGTIGRNYLIRLKNNGTLDTDFCVNASDGGKFNGNINSIAIQSNGKILIGGAFFNYPGATSRNRLIRLNGDGTVDSDFCVNATDGNKFIGNIESIAVQPDNKILVGGDFSNYPGATNRNRFIRLDSNGLVDNSFCANATDNAKFTSTIRAIAVQSDGKILVGGNFTSYPGGTSRNRFIRLDSNGLVDGGFCTFASDGDKFTGQINSIAIQSDGKILVGGAFTNYPGATNRNRLIRLNNNGTTDNPFCVNAVDGKFNNSISSVLIVSGVGIYVAGSFTEKVRLIDQTSGLTISDLPINLRPSSIIPTTTVSQYTNNSLFIGSNPNNQVYGALISLDRLYNII